MKGTYTPTAPAEPMEKTSGTISGVATDIYTGRIVIPDLVSRTTTPNYLQQQTQIGSTEQYSFQITTQYYGKEPNPELNTILNEVVSTIRIP